MLVEWNHYITEELNESGESTGFEMGQGAGVNPVYYEVFYGPLDFEEDDPVSTATSLSLILQMVFIF